MVRDGGEPAGAALEREQAETRWVQEEQFPLGLLPISGFTGEAIELVAGDLLVVATDGVLEVCDRHGEEFGIERLERAIEANARKPLAELSGDDSDEGAGVWKADGRSDAAGDPGVRNAGQEEQLARRV